MAELKIGRNVFDINERDVVLFNGVCWQLITRKIHKGWHDCSPTVSKTMCNKFVKKDILVMFKKEKEYITSNGQQMGMYYYKFDMDKLNEFVNP